VVRVKRSGREQIGQAGCRMLCAPTGRIKSLNANMLHLKPCALRPPILMVLALLLTGDACNIRRQRFQIRTPSLLLTRQVRSN
jgi:hypothetical protein